MYNCARPLSLRALIQVPHTAGVSDVTLHRRLGVADAVVIGLGAFVTFDREAREMRRQLAERIEADPSRYWGEDMRVVLRELMLSPTWRDQHPQDLDRVLGWLQVTSPEAIAAEARAMANLDDLRPELSGLTARVYLRVGEADLPCPPAVSEEICNLVPRGRMDVVPGCGHTLLIEDLQRQLPRLEKQPEPQHGEQPNAFHH